MARKTRTTGLDPASFSASYREAYPSLLMVARAQGARDEADDVVQKAAIVALERLDRFELGSNFHAWMSAIVRGVARNHRRGRKRMNDRHLRLAAMETLDQSPHESPTETSPRVQGIGLDRPSLEFPDGFAEELRNAVDSLGPVQGACLVLRAVHGHSYDEIASMLDIPAATARSHVFRARAVLASSLSPEADEKGGGSDA